MSSLIGNLVLTDFDRELNRDGIICIRYVDDFIILGPDAAVVGKAFAQAQRHLRSLGMVAYDPSRHPPDKAEQGMTDRRFDFLGCQISPGRVQPSKKAIRSFLRNLDENFEQGLADVHKMAKGAIMLEQNRGAVQTISRVNNIVLGWGKSYSFCNVLQVFDSLDREIDQRLFRFLRSCKGAVSAGGGGALRRALHVNSLNRIAAAAMPALT